MAVRGDSYSLLDGLMQFITYFGQELIIIAVICTLYWCVDKRFAYILGFVYFCAGLCVQTLKITFRIPRPWILDPDFHAVASAVPAATGYSFPSGHTQGATSLFFPLALKLRKTWLKALCILTFILVGFSRMYLGCHTPKDVLVSMGISILFAWGIWHFQSILLDDPRHTKIIALALALFSLLVAIYSICLLKNGTIDTKYATDCCKAAGAGLGYSLGWYVERTKLNFDTHTRHIGLQFLKVLLGLAAAGVIKSGFSAIFGTSVLAKMAEYFVLVIWILVLYPALFSKLSKNKQSLNQL